MNSYVFFLLQLGWSVVHWQLFPSIVGNPYQSASKANSVSSYIQYRLTIVYWPNQVSPLFFLGNRCSRILVVGLAHNHKACMVNLVNHEELLAFCGSIGASQWDLHIWATAKTWPSSTEEAEGDESTEKYEPLGPRAHRQRQVGLRPEFSGAIASGKLT